MKKLFLSIAAIFIGCLAQIAFAYNPAQLAAYDQSHPHTCINCDFTNISDQWAVFNASNSVLNNTNFSYSSDVSVVDFSDSNFSNAIAKDAVFEFNNFSDTNFTDAQLNNTDFSYVNATDANFTGANMTGANFESADLYGAKITRAQIASMSNICDTILPSGSTGKCP